MTDTASATSGGDCQARPLRPRPRVCWLATTTAPSGAPVSSQDLATSFVLPIESKYLNGRLRRLVKIASDSVMKSFSCACILRIVSE